MGGAYEDGSDTSEGSTGTGNLSAGVAALAPLPVTRVSYPSNIPKTFRWYFLL